jgi:acetyl esterase
LLVSSGLDPLHDEAIQYLARLHDAGIPHQHLYFDDMVQGFLNLENLVKEECNQVYQTIAQFLNSKTGG